MLPIANAGGPYNARCSAGIIGIWLDGSASWDPDSADPMSYLWTTTCGGSIVDPTRSTTAAFFACDPCSTSRCEVNVMVTDAMGGMDDADAEVVALESGTCMAVSSSLLLVKDTSAGGASGSDVVLTWDSNGALNYNALRGSGKRLSTPTRLVCGPGETFTDNLPATSNFLTYKVSGMSESCE